MARTDTRQHVWASKTYGEMLEHFREYLKTHAAEHAEFRKKVEKIRAARAAKAAPKTSRRRKTS